ncbi:hypothetical protein [Paraurantiacibacter namhicola]|uniref:Uncharacterized protein n=1 Tax=Paraurantiacibacter namhicola TaxID=645517 RepID=A0A1C7D758_9SPHN|nr:hypothetical protein [Paraurantiacibacter namhicola]ANU07285.1 hypothetical protein A6F65_00975 [Paraurantiacibacter namhicola]
MHREGDEVHVDEAEASGGSKEGVVRWILGVGLVLAIGLLSAIWIFGAFTQGDVEEEATATGIAESQDSSGTDGVLLDGSEATDEIGSETQVEDGLEVIEN